MVFWLNYKYVQRASFSLWTRDEYTFVELPVTHISFAPPKSLLIKEDNNIIMIAWVFGNDPQPKF